MDRLDEQLAIREPRAYHDLAWSTVLAAQARLEAVS